MSRKKKRPQVAVRAVEGGRVRLGAPEGLDELGSAGDVATHAHYADAAYYSKTYAGRKEDVAYYVRLARRARGPVLEYGVGNGRIAIPLAEAGAEVVGVDHSKAMLASLKDRCAELDPQVAGRVSWRRGDMRQLRLSRKFSLVLATFNTVLHLYTRRDVERFFARVREHLAPGGRFVFDFSVPRPESLVFDPDRSYGAPPIRHPSLDAITRYGERFDYDPIRQVLLVDMEFHPDRGEPWSVPLTHRQFFPQEMEALLHYNGFGAIRFTGDFGSDAPNDETDTIVASCRARSERAKSLKKERKIRRRGVAGSRRRA